MADKNPIIREDELRAILQGIDYSALLALNSITNELIQDSTIKADKIANSTITKDKFTEDVRSYLDTTENVLLIDGVRAYRRSGTVTIKIDKVATVSAATWLELGTLPSGWRPPAQIYGMCTFGDKNCRTYANPDGRVAVYPFSNSGRGSVVGSFSFPIS